MKPRQKMQTFDWLLWALLVAAGVYIGLAIDGLLALAVIGAWASIVTILALAAFGIVLYWLLERVFNFISTGRWALPRQLQKPRRPLILILGLPLGIVIGVIGAQFGLGELLV